MTQHPPAANEDGAPQRVETKADADALCVRLGETMAELIGVLARETELLKRGKPQDIAAIYARKTALSTILTHDLGLLGRDADFIKMAVPDRIAEIKAQHRTFQKSLDANQDALQAMKAVSEQLLHTIAAKAGAQRAGPEVYGNNAGLAAAGPARPAAISVDRSL